MRIRSNISLEPGIMAWADDLMYAMRTDNFSALLAHLIRQEYQRLQPAPAPKPQKRAAAASGARAKGAKPKPRLS